MSTFGGGFGASPNTGLGAPKPSTGFGQLTAPGGFGQPQPQATLGGFGQPQQQTAGGFGQPATTGGFGQPQQQTAGGFGQPAAAPGGFGQPQQQAAVGGFWQPQQQTAGGFGQPTAAAGGFGQPQQQTAGGFGQPQQQTAGGFGQPATTGGFGQPQQQTAGGFGQPAAAPGGFGQPQQQAAVGGFGQPATAGGFGQTQQQTAGGFGQPAAAPGGFGQPQQQATGGFGQPATTGGFGQPAAPGGFGQPAGGAQPAAGGFGAAKPAGGFGSAGGFGQPQSTTTGGFGAAKPPTGFGQPGTGFGQPQQQATGGFGQPAAPGGFGQPAGGAQPAAGGFGAAKPAGGFGSIGGFGQPAAPGGFGQPQQQTTGGFGQPAAPGGFGQPQQQTTGGFGQPAAPGGFGQPQQQAAGGFGAAKPAGGFGSIGGFGQPAAPGGFGQPQQPAAGGFGTLPGTNLQTTTGFGKAPQSFSSGATLNEALSFMNLPDFNVKPYGEALLAPYDRPALAKPAPTETAVSLPIIPQTMQYNWLTRRQLPLDSDDGIKQQPVPLSTSAISSSALKAILEPPIQFGTAIVDKKASDLVEPRLRLDELTSNQDATRESNLEAPFSISNPSAPWCDNAEYGSHPSLEELALMQPSDLRHVSPFEVFRKDGKVHIEFCEPVNLVRVNISEAVAMDKDGRVRFHPIGDASSHKGLNVKAIVTVNRVVNMTDDQLRETCIAEGNRFISYQNNSWRYIINDPDATVDILRYEGTSRDNANLSIQKGDDDDDDHDDDVGAVAQNWQNVYKRDGDRAIVPQPLLGEVEPPVKSTQLIPPAALGNANMIVKKTSLPPSQTSQKWSSLNKQVPFKLPYELPDMIPKTKKQQMEVGPYSPLREREPPVYYVNYKDSIIHEHFVSESTLKNQLESSISLARSFRAGWHISGILAFPSFASMRDGLEAKQDVDEVRGCNVVINCPFKWTSPSSKPLTACLVSVLRLLTRHMRVLPNSEHPGESKLEPLMRNHYGLLHVSLCREKSSTTLSEEKLQEILSVVVDPLFSRACLSPTELCSMKQCQSVIGLLRALYALPEHDEALPNALEEVRYLKQFRRRQLANWLSNELHDLVNCKDGVYPSKSEELVQIILCHRLKEASQLAEKLNDVSLARVIGVCGDGNQFGQYVEMARTGFSDGAVVRDRVVSLLSGKVETFMREDEYTFEKHSSQGSDTIVAHHHAATWKQLLGIFTFYGCPPGASAEEIISEFMDRLCVASRRSKPLPPYAEKLHDGDLQSRRGRDVVCRGNTFQDAAFLLLKGFIDGGAPPAASLHPHASSYCGSDYLTPFIILIVVRALQLPRERMYTDVETSVLLGLAAQLEQTAAVWYWALVPLHMINPVRARQQGVRGFCRRNALRAQGLKKSSGDNASAAEFEQLLSLLNVDQAELEPVIPPAEQPNVVSLNKPSLKTQEALQKAMKCLQNVFKELNIVDV